jgi:hypothetical protein
VTWEGLTQNTDVIFFQKKLIKPEKQEKNSNGE